MTSPRVLIVANGPASMLDLRQQVLELGYMPMAEERAADGGEGASGRECPDLILVDLDCSDAAERVAIARASYGELALPVACILSTACDETTDRLRELEPYGSVMRPYAAQALRLVVEGALSRFRAEVRQREGREGQAAILHGQKQVLEKIAAGAALAETLEELLRFIEGESRGLVGSILLLDAGGAQLCRAVAPSLPRDYLEALEGCAFGPLAPACGSAALQRRSVIVEDIANNPLSTGCCGLALRHGFRSCWSTPILDSSGEVLGVFVLYFRQPGRPSSRHERIIEIAIQLAAIAISRERADESRRRSETKFRTLYDSAPDSVLLMDEQSFLDCNPAALSAFGCKSKDDLRSRHPSELSPPRQTGGGDSRLLANQRIAAALATGTQRFEWLHQRIDNGATFPAEVLLTAFELDGKRLLQAVVRDITERKRSEEVLRKNEDRYRDLVDNSRELISTYDLDGNFLSVNETTVRLTGYSRETLLKMNLADLVAADTRHLFSDYLGAIQVAGRVRGIMKVRIASGDHRYWDYDSTLRTEGVAVPLIRGMALDVTERLRSDRALLASNERFELASRATFDVIWDWNLETHAFWRNDNFRELFGYDPGEIEPNSESAFDLVHPGDRERVRATLKSALESAGEHWEVRYRFRRKDGSFATVEDRAIITRDASGRAIRMLGAMQDVSERAQAESQLLLQGGALEAAANSIFITDRDGVIEWANQAFTTSTGYSLEEAVGKRPGDLIRSGRQDARYYQEMWDAILAGAVWRGELVNRRKDRSTYTEEVTITPLRDANGEITHFVAVKQDVSQRNLLEAKLRQAERLEAVGRLAGGVAHDFNNMLGVILGFTEMALREVDPAQQLHADLLEVEKAARRSADLTRQLLSFARQETIAPKPLDLNDSVSGMLAMLRRLIGEGIHVTFTPEAGLWQVQMDPSQVDHVLANLCVNARDAINDIGSIAIACGNRRIGADAAAFLVDAAPGDYVRLSVSDTGRGMDKETLAQVFEPFFTTKAVGEGTGLGLATVYGVVKQNKGFITVHSEAGRGTRFEIYLPRYEGESEVAKVTVSALLRQGQETILLVEDEPAVLKLTRRALVAQGYTVVAAGGPREAIRLASEHAGAIDLLLTDVMMPEMNGRDLADALTASHPSLRRLFMSGFSADVVSAGGVLDEGVRFLQKPFSLAELAAQVREVLDRD